MLSAYIHHVTYVETIIVHAAAGTGLKSAKKERREGKQQQRMIWHAYYPSRTSSTIPPITRTTTTTHSSTQHTHFSLTMSSINHFMSIAASTLSANNDEIDGKYDQVAQHVFTTLFVVSEFTARQSRSSSLSSSSSSLTSSSTSFDHILGQKMVADIKSVPTEKETIANVTFFQNSSFLQPSNATTISRSSSLNGSNINNIPSF